MKLILHIGSHKTGSTSIQDFLSTNRENLQSNGIFYPRSLGRSNHRRAALFCLSMKRGANLFKKENVHSEEDRLALKKKIRRRFSREMESLRDIHTVVISCEHLHSRFHSNQAFVQLKELLGDHFTEVTVVCYLRPPIDQISSLYTTAVRHECKLTIDEFVERSMSNLPPLDHRRVVKSWAKHFGEENLNLRLFNDTKSLPNGVVSDFIGVLGLPEHDAWELPRRRNSSIDPTGQEILRLRNLVSSANEPWSRQFRDVVGRLVIENFSGKGAMPSLPVAKAFAEQLEESSRWVQERWFPQRQNAFATDWQEWPTSAPGMVPVEFIHKLLEQLYLEQNPEQLRRESNRAPGLSSVALAPKYQFKKARTKARRFGRRIAKKALSVFRPRNDGK